MKRKIRTDRKACIIYILLPLLLYVFIKSLLGGQDINVYLYASEQFYLGKNIYAENPFNNYLYSPFFAFILRPLSIFELPAGRVLWAFLNVIFTIRIWVIIYKLIKFDFALQKKLRMWFIAGMIALSLGWLNHNLILGQITILLLWFTVEGLYQILLKKNIYFGAILLSLGIVIKIIPILTLYFLFLKRKIKAIFIIIFLCVFFLFLPAVFAGIDYNSDMLSEWFNTVNPSEKYIFEDSNSTQSLNSVLPAFFYDFDNGSENQIYKRKIIYISYENLSHILQLSRIALLLSFSLLVVYKTKSRKYGSLSFLREVSYLGIITILIFPHQQKYTLLYCLPAFSYVLIFILNVFNKFHGIKIHIKIVSLLYLMFFIFSAVSGRDIIGDKAIFIIDYYHIHSLIALLLLLFLHKYKPNDLLNKHGEIKHK
jgi:hypothetical protein